MAKKVSSKRPDRMTREQRSARTRNVFFMILCVMMVLAMLVSAFGRF